MIEGTFSRTVFSDRVNLMAPLTLATILCWVLLLLGSGSMAVPAICSGELIWSLPSAAEYSSFFTFVSPVSLAAGWAAMIVAMMLPTTVLPLLHVHRRSFPRVRFLAIASFTTGYLAVWMVAGLILIGSALSLRMIFTSVAAPSVLVSVAAIIWHSSPFKQIALNRCHGSPRIGAFAPLVYVEALEAGARQGVWCVIACWPLMLLALVFPMHHFAVMAFATCWIWAERLEHSRAPKWLWRSPVAIARLASSRARRWTRTLVERTGRRSVEGD